MASENTYIQPAVSVAAATRRYPFQLALSAFSTNASFTALDTELAVITEPAVNTSTAVITMGDRNLLRLFPIATAAEDTTSSRQVFGVRPVLDSTGSILGYRRDLFIQFLATTCAVPVDAAICGAQANAFYSDQITVTTSLSFAQDPAGFVITTNDADVPASITIDTMGYPVIVVKYAVNSGTSTAMNDFYTTL